MPRRKGAVETDEALTGITELEPGSQSGETLAPAADKPSSQLALYSFDSAAESDEMEGPDEPDELDESAELLVSVSSETLAGSPDPEGVEAEKADEVEARAQGLVEAEPIAEGGAYESDLLEDDVEVGTADLHARQSQHEPTAGSLLDQPGLQIRLARIHLRTGSLFMARAELEALAAREQLDKAAHLDLAEARWRTGDLQGAGEAAAAYLADGGGAALGFVIAAEAFAMANRHAEAREHAARALERHLSELDPVFAGMPRRASWPARAWTRASADAPPERSSEAEPVATPAPPTPAPPTPAPPPPAEALRAEAPTEETVRTAQQVAPVEEAAVDEAPAAAERPIVAAAVEADASASGSADVAQAEEGAGAEVAAGRSFLEAGDPMMAALHFGVAIRLTPASAAAVLDAIGDRQDLPLRLVRGDALRLLGLEADAGSTYLSVASALGAGKSVAPEPPTEAAAPVPSRIVQPIADEPPVQEPPVQEPPVQEPPVGEEPPASPDATEAPPLHWE